MGFISTYFKDFYYRKDFIAYARHLGVEVGEECKILCNPRKAFGSEPWLIKIGNHVEITGGCKILTHDGSVWVIRNQYPHLAVWGSVVIGDNVFIGEDAIIMPGIEIGDNCVIGAGSIVTKNIPSNSVVAGCPARVISDYNAFSEKIRRKAISIMHIKKSERKEYCRSNYPEIFPNGGNK